MGGTGNERVVEDVFLGSPGFERRNIRACLWILGLSNRDNYHADERGESP